jgi:hypothetical protein
MQKDFKALGIKVVRETRKSSLTRVVIDHFTFSIGNRKWYVKVLRSDSIVKRSGRDTLSTAVKALANAHGVEFYNVPKRVDKSTVKWVSPKEIGEGEGNYER